MEGLFDKKTGYLIDIVPDLVEDIKNDKSIALIAPTGSGKTTATTGILKGKKMFKGLVDYFPNCWVCVPFNATNELYEGPGMNVVASYNTNKVKKGKPNVAVIDQFNLHINEILANLPDVIFVDESHEIYLEEEFRDSAEEFYINLSNLMSMGVKIVLISATPAGEVGYLKATVISYENNEDKSRTKFEFIKTEDTYDCMYKDMMYAKGYDRIAIFSDRDAWRLYEHGILNDRDIFVCHSKRRNNVLHLVSVEKLEHYITVLTKIAYQGLNINNEDERILVCVRYTYNDTTINEILQIKGRFRKCKDLTIRIYFDGKYDGRSVADFLADCNDAQILVNHNATEFITPYYSRLVSNSSKVAITGVRKYRSNFTLRNLFGSLKGMGYECVWKEYNASKVSHAKPYKRIASDMFKNMIMNETQLDTDDVNIKMYVEDWQRRLARLVALNGDVVKDEFENLLMITNKNGKVNSGNVETHMRNLEDGLRIHNMTEEEWNDWLVERNILLKDPNLSVYMKRRIKTIIKRNDHLRDQFKKLDITGSLEIIIGLHYDVMKRYLDGNSKGGKNSAKRLYDTINDCYYESCKVASEKLGVSIQTISKRIKKGILVKRDD